MDPSSDTNPVDRGLNNHFTGSASFLMEMSTGRGEGSQFSLESPLRASLDDSSVERLEDSHHVLQKWANDDVLSQFLSDDFEEVTFLKSQMDSTDVRDLLVLLQGAVAELESYIRLEVKENLDELVQHSIRVQSIQNSFVDVRSSSQEVKSRFSRIHNRVAKCCAELRTLCARSSRIQIAMDLASSTNHALILLKRVRRLESSLDEGMLHRICDSAVIEQPKLALLIQELQILLKDTQILKIQAVQNQISTSKIASRLLQKFSTEASSSSSS